MTARWPQWGLAALLACTAIAYLWGLSASGYGNDFYAAAAQAGSQSWSAWFFGSLDARNFITVDKPPAALWVTGFSVRAFGVSSWSVLAPQALMGVAAVAILFSTVRRAIGDPALGAAAGLIAGAVLACTPAAAMMFRLNDPDALLTMLLTTAAYCLTRAVHTASWRWLAAVGVTLGFAFLTKMLQGFLVLPGFAVAYLLLAPTSWRKRALHLAIAAAALVVSSGWWVLAVQLIPRASRPYVGGSSDDSVLNLVLGYNGVSRLTGHGSRSGSTTVGANSLRRLFTTEMANEISWLLPAALVAVAIGAHLTLRGRLGRDERAALLSWACWLGVTGLVLSFMRGTVHAYYTVALAPAVAALVGLASAWAWRDRHRWDGRVALAGLLGAGGWWSSILLRRDHFGPDWAPRVIEVTALAAVVCILAGRQILTRAGVVVGTASATAGVVAFSLATVATPHRGAVPDAVYLGALRGSAGRAIANWTGDEATNPDLAAMLAATDTPWSAATNGSQSAAALELSTRTSVMAIGGWSGDPTPTLGQFVDDVRAAKITYYVEAGRGGTDQVHGRVVRSEEHGVSHGREIADWVADHYRATTVGTSLVYRLI